MDGLGAAIESRPRKHKTWAMSPEFERLGKMFEQAQDFESRKAAYLELVAEWENQTPGMYLGKCCELCDQR